MSRIGAGGAPRVHQVPEDYQDGERLHRGWPGRPRPRHVLPLPQAPRGGRQQGRLGQADVNRRMAAG